MSRREGRDYESRRHRSRIERKPSPKRSRRDVKLVAEKDARNSSFTDRDRKHHHRTEDTVPREPSKVPDSKIPDGSLNKDFEKKLDGNRGGAKHSSDVSSLSRSRSFVQHHERGNAGPAGQSDGRNSTSERGWWRDSKDRQAYKSAATRRDGNSQTKGEDEGAWSHDGFFEMEAGDPLPPARKRPPFRENKVPAVSENSEKTVDAKKVREPHQPEDKRGKREERGRQSRRFERVEEEGAEGKMATGWQASTGGYPARDRFGGGGGGVGYYSGRDRSRHWTNQVKVEKWKHDLFEEANRSPASKNEEDQIAKVEAMLAS